jgi:DnaJ-class molecular chaperone
MSKRDPYKVLGVRRTALADDIKKAYRALALKHHPDRNHDSKASETKFKEIQHAYEILSDPEKRRLFNLHGHAGLDPNYQPQDQRRTNTNPFENFGGGRAYNFRADTGSTGGSGFNVFDDVFSDLFGNDSARSHTKRKPEKGEHIHYDLTINFDDAYNGVSVDVKALSNRISVQIPAGVDTGAVVRAPGQGAPGRRGGKPGDLLLNITVRPHHVFRREGCNVYLTLPVMMSEALLGARVEIPAPDGRVVLKIPPGTQSGTNFRFKGKGFPEVKKSSRGDFFVVTHIMIPELVTPESLELIHEFERLNPMSLRTGL